MASRKRERVEQTSHKVIEKRRRDRINSCLLELSQTVPAAFSKQTTGKLEKAEILEMTVEYLRAVQTTEIGMRFDNGEWFSTDIWTDFAHHYQTGYSECVREVLKYMTDVEGIALSDSRYSRLISFLHNRFRSELASVPASSFAQNGTGNHSKAESLGSYVSSRPGFHASSAARELSAPVCTVSSTLGGNPPVDTRLLALPPFSPVQAGDGQPVSRLPSSSSNSFPTLSFAASSPFGPLGPLAIPAAVDLLRLPPSVSAYLARGPCTPSKEGFALDIPPVRLPHPPAVMRKGTCSSV